MTDLQNAFETPKSAAGRSVLISTYGLSPAQVRPHSRSGSHSRPSSRASSSVVASRPASRGALARPASTGQIGFAGSSSMLSSAAEFSRPFTAPELGSSSRARPGRSRSGAPGGGFSVKEIVEVTQKRPGEVAEEAGEDEEFSVPKPPRPGMMLRRPRRRPPASRRKAAKDRLLEAAPSENSLWADAQGTSSESESGGESGESEDAKSPHKSHQHSQKAEAAAHIGASAAATAAAQQGERERRRAQNPFVEYEDRETRLRDERRWLKDDAIYLTERTEELRFNNVQRSLDVSNISTHHLFENACIYNEYSHYIRLCSELREALRRRRDPDGALRELALPKIPRLKAAIAQQKRADRNQMPQKDKAAQKEKPAVAPEVKEVQCLEKMLKDSHAKMPKFNEAQEGKKKKWTELDPMDLAAKKGKSKTRA